MTMSTIQIEGFSNHNNLYYSKKTNRLNRRCVNFKGDSFESKTPAISEYEEQKLKVLKNGFNAIALVLFTGVILSLFKKPHSNVSVSPTPKHSADLRDDLLKPFVSLKDDKSIPFLNECNSIDNKVKKFLLRQVKLEELENNGGEEVQVANRILLIGPPGVGKTFDAQVFAKTIGAEFTEVRFADYNSRWVGEGIENMKAIFEMMESVSSANPDNKYVALFNELESVVTSIDKINNGSGLSAHMLDKIEERDTFITYMDELVKKCPNLIIVGTTNVTPEKGLDTAIVSRFKKNLIEVDLPNENCLFEALKKRLSDFKIYKNEDDAIIKATSQKMAERGCSYRDLNAIVDNSYEQYLLEKSEIRDFVFNPKTLEEELSSIKLTDGELYKKNSNTKGV